MPSTPLFLIVIVGWVLIFVAALPLALGRVGPNALYGFRTERTMGDPAVWYPANAYAGRVLMKAAVAGVLLECLLGWMAAKAYLSPLQAVWGALLLVIAPLTLAVFAAFRYLRTL